MCFDASVFGLKSPALPENCSMAMEILRDNKGKETERRRYGVPKMGGVGQGFPFKSYRPLSWRREQFVEWTFTHAFESTFTHALEVNPAVAGIHTCTKDDKAMFPLGVDNSIGAASWSWPENQISKQNLAPYEQFDPTKSSRGEEHICR